MSKNIQKRIIKVAETLSTLNKKAEFSNKDKRYLNEVYKELQKSRESLLVAWDVLQKMDSKNVEGKDDLVEKLKSAYKITVHVYGVMNRLKKLKFWY